MATLKIIEEEDLTGNAQRMGALLRNGLEGLQRRYPGDRFIWLMGADTVAQFHQWRRWRGYRGSMGT